MKKRILLVFLFLFSCAFLFAAEQEKASLNTEQLCVINGAQEVDRKETMIEKVKDWFATFGKTDEQKAQILEERRQNSELESLEADINTYKKELKENVESMKEKVKEEVSVAKEKIKEKAAKIKQDGANQAAAQLKEKAKCKMEEAKQKANAKVEVHKDRLAQEVDKKLNDAKGFLDNLLK